MKSREYAKVIGQEKIAPDIYSLRIEAPQIAAEAKAGQFLSLYSADKSRMLPRPISICEIDPDQGYIRLVYRVVEPVRRNFPDCVKVTGFRSWDRWEMVSR